MGTNISLEPFASALADAMVRSDDKVAKATRTVLLSFGADGAAIVSQVEANAEALKAQAIESAKEVVASITLADLSAAAKATFQELTAVETRENLAAKDKELTITEFKALFGEVPTPAQIASQDGWDLLFKYQAAKHVLGETFVLSYATRRTLADLA